MSKRSSAQDRVIGLLKSGQRLFWFGDEGPEMSGESFWPQKRTVRAMLEAGLLRWLPHANPSQRECGTRELVLTDAVADGQNEEVAGARKVPDQP